MTAESNTDLELSVIKIGAKHVIISFTGIES